MSMDTETLGTLLAEVVQGIPASKSCLPATDEIAAMRLQLTDEVAQIAKDHPGWVTDIPKEWPAVQVPARVAAKGLPDPKAAAQTTGRTTPDRFAKWGDSWG